MFIKTNNVQSQNLKIYSYFNITFSGFGLLSHNCHKRNALINEFNARFELINFSFLNKNATYKIILFTSNIVHNYCICNTSKTEAIFLPLSLSRHSYVTSHLCKCCFIQHRCHKSGFISPGLTS